MNTSGLPFPISGVSLGLIGSPDPVGTNWIGFSVTGNTDATNAVENVARPLPNSACLTAVEVQIDDMSGPPGTVTMMLAHDSLGDEPITVLTADATQSITAGITTAGKGYVRWGLDTDFKFFPGDNADRGVVYCFLKVDSGSIDEGRIRLYWRGDSPT